MDIHIKTQEQNDKRIVCHVQISDEMSVAHYQVSINRTSLGQLNVDPDEVASVVDASFRFLLDRESKEAILSEFEIMEIARYFPEYMDEIHTYMKK